MKRKTLLIMLLLFALALPVSASVPWVGSQYAGHADLIASFPFQNGDTLLVSQVSEPTGLQHFEFTYMRADGTAEYSQSQKLGKPDKIVVHLCGGTVQVLTQADYAVYRYEWQLPINLNQVYLPIVCNVGHEGE